VDNCGIVVWAIIFGCLVGVVLGNISVVFWSSVGCSEENGSIGVHSLRGVVLGSLRGLSWSNVGCSAVLGRFSGVTILGVVAGNRIIHGRIFIASWKIVG
jgi:hypothetical protein